MSEDLLDFKKSQSLTMGVELELQLIDRRTGDLTRAASDLIALVTRKPFPGDIKPEITESMLEVSTAVHATYSPLRAALLALRGAAAPEPPATAARSIGRGIVSPAVSASVSCSSGTSGSSRRKRPPR